MSELVLEMSDITYELVGNAIRETFSSILGLSLELKTIQHGPLKNPPKNVSGFVILKNPTKQGTLSIGFPNETALQIFSNFYGSKIEQIDERVLEGVGEITNMVYGALKKYLNQEGFDFEMFIPFIVIGNEFNDVKEDGAKSSVTIEFVSPSGNFWVEINMQKVPKIKKVNSPKNSKKTSLKSKKNRAS